MNCSAKQTRVLAQRCLFRASMGASKQKCPSLPLCVAGRRGRGPDQRSARLSGRGANSEWMYRSYFICFFIWFLFFFCVGEGEWLQIQTCVVRKYPTTTHTLFTIPAVSMLPQCDFSKNATLTWIQHFYWPSSPGLHIIQTVR